MTSYLAVKLNLSTQQIVTSDLNSTVDDHKEAAKQTIGPYNLLVAPFLDFLSQTNSPFVTTYQVQPSGRLTD
jgi:hypothetical protein